MSISFIICFQIVFISKTAFKLVDMLKHQFLNIPTLIIKIMQCSIPYTANHYLCIRQINYIVGSNECFGYSLDDGNFIVETFVESDE